ncbi:peptide/nickel transport system permease protein [Abditibacterium utsteinense]|uniref:Peptide/nickel transport system permease protein n=1 Tax=Abditibacterium utsteinense TaxID=1960156 RepID=A0A2S8SV45_9BACT|nr:ABC transporter permease [Abditibacterium utsteinense]PQV64663.1 peptide/nickel transport system permease protein [Abditibacterium utsteinense]
MTADSSSLVLPAPKSAPNTFARFVKNPLALVGALILLLLFAGALLAPWLGKTADPNQIYAAGLDKLGVPTAPGATFRLGADTLGHDVWTRVIFGARVSLGVAFCAMLTSTLIGTTLGLLGGFFGGRTDRALTRFTEIIAALPTILLAITLSKVLPDRLPDFWLFKLFHVSPDLTLPRLLLAIGLVTWTGIARAVRGQTLALKQREFVEAARALGVSNLGILTRHLLPNVMPTVIVLATLATANTILLEAGLSYLGLGDPARPSWGSQISDGQPYFASAPWIVLVPGAAIVLAVTAFNLLGNALQDALETR